MQSVVRIIALSVCLLTPFAKLFATHSVGIDLNYECLGGNNYRFVLNFYRDCNGIDAPDPEASVQLYSTSCGVNATLDLELQSVTEVSPLCPAQFPNSTCQNGILPGIEQYVYAGNFTLPLQCVDWVISYTLCCRNYAITNLYDPGSQNIYAEVTLNNTGNLCNNSPVFTTLPVPYFCANQTFNYNHGASDIDGDSLVYTLISPRTDRTTIIPYVSGFSPSSPLATNGTFNFDRQTGQMTFNARPNQQAVVSVRVDEYRNGVIIGSTIRDLQLVVLPCSNNLPAASGINGTPGFTATVCIGGQACLDITTTDPDAGQTTTLTYNGGLPGAVFTTSGSPFQSGQLCFTPTVNDIGTYHFSVTVVDNACPVVGRTAYTYTVIVQGNTNPPINVGSDMNLCEGECVSLDEVNRPAGVIYTWTPTTGLSDAAIPNPTACPQITTTYTLHALYPDGCAASDDVQVTVHPVNPVDIFPENSVICAGASLQLNASAAPNSTLLWTTGETTSSIIVTPTTSGFYAIEAVNQYGCSAYDTAYIDYSPPPPPQVCNVLYVTPTGTGAGLTPADPTDLLTAVSLAQCNNLTIKMATGTYTIDNPLTLTSLLTIEGGFDAGIGWQKTSLAGATTILRSALNPEGSLSAQRIVGAYVNSAVYFRLQDITIRTADAPASAQEGISTYALHMTNCSNYEIVRCQFIAGNAGAGEAGSDGADGANGGNGADGELGDADAGCCTLGGAGGTSPVGNPGAAGGDGGPRGNNPGTAGSNAPGGGAGGNGGLGNGNCNFGCDANATHDGGNGAPGTPGTAGSPGAMGAAGSISSGFFSPGSQGSSGGDGSDGTGGGGGGGGGGQGNCIFGLTNGAGPGGGGGGGGAQGGKGGSGGFGGGASFGVYLFSNGANGNFIDCAVAAGNAGAGGAGGAGGNGGTGGAGGNGDRSDCDLGYGGDGGVGGNGGNGGAGGNGAPGISNALQADGGLPLVSAITGFPLATQPVITAANVSCTNRPVNYTAASAANWTFGNGATPATANTAGAAPSYTNIGRKNITYNGEPYTGFVNIAIDSAAYKPNIGSTAAEIAPDTFFLCADEGADFTSDAFGVAYSWDFGGAINPNTYTTKDIPGLIFTTTGTFLISLRVQTDCCGWSVPDSVTLVVEPRAPVAFAGDTTLCEGESTVITLSGASSYAWLPDVGSLNGPVATVTVSPAVTTTYLASGFSSSGNCNTEVNVTIHVNEIPAVATTAVSATCTNDGSATAHPTGGSGTYNYLWNDVNAQSTSTAANLFSGNYTVTVTDANSGCANTAFAFVPSAGPIAYIQNTTPVTCYGGTDGTATVAGTGGAPGYTFLWETGNSGATISGLAQGHYSVTLTDNAGCNSVATAFVNQPDSMVVDIFLIDSTQCFDDADGRAFAAADGGNGAYSYQWFADPLLTTPVAGEDTAEHLATGTYYVFVSDRNGCTARNSIFIPGGIPFTLDSAVVNPLCFDSANGSIAVLVSGAAGGYSYLWNPQNIHGSFANNLSAGNYSVTIIDAAGCDTSVNFILTTPASSSVAIVPADTTISLGESVQLASVYQSANVLNPLTYNWSPAALNCDTCANPVAAPTEPTLYTLVVTDANGCPATATAFIDVAIDKILWAPNAFTPNGDDVNDIFYVYGKNIKDFHLIIADRWGEKIFESTSLSLGWDGTYQGKLLNPGVFVYSAHVIFMNGEEKREKGSVTLLR